MKSILFVVGAVSIFFGNVKATCDIGLIDDDTNADVFHRPSPKTRSGKCLYECMLRVANMLGENGLINADHFVEFLSTSKKIPDDSLTKMKTATNNCKFHKHLSEDKCETAALFVQCTSEEAAKSDLDPTIMAKAIHAAYYHLKPTDTRPPPSPQEHGYFIFSWPSIDWWPH